MSEFSVKPQILIGQSGSIRETGSSVNSIVNEAINDTLFMSLGSFSGISAVKRINSVKGKLSEDALTLSKMADVLDAAMNEYKKTENSVTVQLGGTAMLAESKQNPQTKSNKKKKKSFEKTIKYSFNTIKGILKMGNHVMGFMKKVAELDMVGAGSEVIGLVDSFFGTAAGGLMALASNGVACVADVFGNKVLAEQYYAEAERYASYGGLSDLIRGEHGGGDDIYSRFWNYTADGVDGLIKITKAVDVSGYLGDVKKIFTGDKNWYELIGIKGYKSGNGFVDTINNIKATVSNITTGLDFLEPWVNSWSDFGKNIGDNVTTFIQDKFLPGKIIKKLVDISGGGYRF